jgi:hypothetical protein
MGRSTAASKRQDQRNDFISKVAVDLGLPPELSTIDRVLLWQAADLLLWNPVDIEQAMRRADTVRRLVENVEHRHGGNGAPRRMPRQAPETAAGAGGGCAPRGLQGHPRALARRPLRVRGRRRGA